MILIQKLDRIQSGGKNCVKCQEHLKLCFGNKKQKKKKIEKNVPINFEVFFKV